MEKLREDLTFKIAYGILFLVIMGMYFYKLLVQKETNVELLIVLCTGVISFWIGKVVGRMKA